MFSRLGSWCVRRRRTVVAAWLLALVGLSVLSGALGSDIRSEFQLPDVESRAGFLVLMKDFHGLGAGAQGNIVFLSPDGFQDQGVRDRLQKFLDEVDALPRTTVRSPFAPGGAVQISSRGERAGQIAYAQVELGGHWDRDTLEAFARKVKERAPSIDGVRIDYGGQIFGGMSTPSSEMLGVAFAIVILVMAFGSVLAMGLPIGVALGGIGAGSALLMLVSNIVQMPDFATTMGMMIGLGVGIDYALFIVTRYREQLRVGHTVEESVAIALDTSGRAVLFAGITVVISLLGMLVMNVNFVTGLALGASIIVTATMVASLTLLPALLGFVGRRVEVTRWRGLLIAGAVSLAMVGAGLHIAPLTVVAGVAGAVLVLASLVTALLRRDTFLSRQVPARRERPLRETRAYRWSRLVQRRPWTAAFGGAALLVLLAIPMLSLRLGFSDDGNRPADATTRRAYDLMAEGFGPGFNGPLLLAAKLPPAATPEQLAALTKAIESTPGVAETTPAVPNAAQPTAVLWRVIPSTAPQDAATTELVHRLRSEVLPAATRSAGVDAKVLVTGFVAVTVDFSDYLGQRMPWFFGAVLALSFMLLMVVFRSLLVPVKAVIMNLLSIGAAYGLMVAVFQWGWGRALLGVEPAPVEPFLPMMMFAIVFGLSMDYEVFLISRIREEWLRTGDARESVADGLAATAKVITAAAAIMVFVFGSFLLEAARVVKLMGFGLAAAVLLDATVVRLLLVPATMELLGDRNWWLPRWLERLLPTVNVEGSTEVSDSGEPPASPEDRDRQPELV